MFAFEVANILLRRRGACSVVKQIPGARITRRPKLFSWFREDDFCEFEIDGITFVISEPFGDNSRYWIGPKPPRWVPQLAVVRETFIKTSGLWPT